MPEQTFESVLPRSFHTGRVKHPVPHALLAIEKIMFMPEHPEFRRDLHKVRAIRKAMKALTEKVKEIERQLEP